ncbi:LOW QUALITY PROTEIN: DNA-3-methyladenine glycosylase [Vibrio sp. JCM 19053]|nr:LOW QUALITY PROTEIN: DNA-3-methyladenine glycosylase [Vibrio sp. JCM 19053]
MNHPLEREYHDSEWGVPVYDDQVLFEFITLEGAQAGLSWITILKKREGIEKRSRTTLDALEQRNEERAEYIVENFDVVRHRGKINSVFSNAKAAKALIAEYGSLSDALWQFVDGEPIINQWQHMSDVPVSTEQSKAMSKFLKKEGFKFVGETICYAFMQAVGMVDDHIVGCPKKQHK